jgi:hypothetical protein
VSSAAAHAFPFASLFVLQDQEETLRADVLFDEEVTWSILAEEEHATRDVLELRALVCGLDASFSGAQRLPFFMTQQHHHQPASSLRQLLADLDIGCDVDAGGGDAATSRATTRVPMGSSDDEDEHLRIFNAQHGAPSTGVAAAGGSLSSSLGGDDGDRLSATTPPPPITVNATVVTVRPVPRSPVPAAQTATTRAAEYVPPRNPLDHLMKK